MFKVITKTILVCLCAVIGTSLLRAEPSTKADTTLVIFRTNTDNGAAYIVRNAEQPLGSLQPGERIVVHVPTGTHQLVVDAQAKQRFFIEATAGDTLFVQVSKDAQSTEQTALLSMSSLNSFIDFAPGPR